MDPITDQSRRASRGDFDLYINRGNVGFSAFFVCFFCFVARASPCSALSLLPSSTLLSPAAKAATAEGQIQSNPDTKRTSLIAPDQQSRRGQSPNGNRISKLITAVDKVNRQDKTDAAGRPCGALFVFVFVFYIFSYDLELVASRKTTCSLAQPFHFSYGPPGSLHSRACSRRGPRGASTRAGG